MAGKKSKTKTVAKVKKKNWYQIVAPKLFNNTIIGETTAISSSTLTGKTVQHNLMYLTGDPKSQNTIIKFKIESVKEEKAQTYMIGYNMLAASLKRFVRRGKDKIDDSIYLKTADNKIVQIKPFVLTRANTTRTVKSEIRLAIRELLAEYLSKTTYENFLRDLIGKQIHQRIRQIISKIYPVRSVEIKTMSLVQESLKINKQIIAPKKATLPKETEEEETPKKPSQEEDKKEA